MVGELYAATAGIGFMITVAGATFQTDKVFVGVLIFALTGMMGMEMLTRIERRFDKWRPKVGCAGVDLDLNLSVAVRALKGSPNR